MLYLLGWKGRMEGGPPRAGAIPHGMPCWFDGQLKKRRVLAMLVCFADESGNLYTFTMACAISNDQKWLRLDREWKKSLAEFGVPYFHMKELVARKGPYCNWPQHRADAFIRKLVWVFQAHVMAWCATTVIIRDYYAVVKTDKNRKQRNPYYHAFQTCVGGALVFSSDQFKHSSLDSKVSFMLDAGGASQQRAAFYFAAFKELNGIPNERLGVLLFGNDEKINGLQAADLLAYEVHKHHQGFKRKSYLALRTLPHVDNLCNAKQLRDMFKDRPGLLL